MYSSQDTYLTILPLFNDLLHRFQILFSVCSRIDNPCVDLIDLIHQISFELRITSLELLYSLKCARRSDHRLVTRITFASTDNWSIDRLKLVNKTVLNSKYVFPRITPGFGGVN